MENTVHIDHRSAVQGHAPWTEPDIPAPDSPAGTDLHHQLQRALFDFIAFRINACSKFAGEVDTNLAMGDGPGAREAFQSAENAFESLHRCVLRMEHGDRRAQTEALLDELGLRLDALWVKLISGGFAVL
jgi:hypothetical protein